MNKGLIPEKLINFNVFVTGNVLAGIADITMPDIESMSESISGAGIAGEVDVPTIGHFNSMTMTINFRTTTDDCITLSTPEAKMVEMYNAVQNFNTNTGTREVEKLVVSAKVVPKKLGLGKAAPGASMDASGEYEVMYIKVTSNDKVLLEIDKLNFIYIVNGKDYLADVRAALGM